LTLGACPSRAGEVTTWLKSAWPVLTVLTKFSRLFRPLALTGRTETARRQSETNNRFKLDLLRVEGGKTLPWIATLRSR
jgi:hypothetical protein